MGIYFSGRVHTIIFSNPADSFYIMRMVLDKQPDDVEDMFSKGLKVVTVKGRVPGIPVDVNSWFGFEGRWITHPKHGKQIDITKAPVIKGNWTSESAAQMLETHGIGARVCERLLRKFGDDLVKILDKGDEEDLLSVSGITKFSADHIFSRWRMVKAYFATLEFLTDAGVPKYKISQVWSTFGDEAEKVLSEDPWALVKVDGIKFAQADEVALRLGLDMTSQNRVRGAALYACKDGRGMGHLFLSSGGAVARVQELVPGSQKDDIAEALAELHKDGSLLIDRNTRPNTMAIYEPWSHHLESEGAQMLLERSQTADPMLAVPKTVKNLRESLARLDKSYLESLAEVGVRSAEAVEDGKDLEEVARAALEDWSTGSHITLSTMQIQGAINALTSPVSILTGLPGTGKTTTLKAVVSVLKDANIPFLLCAPTGIAAKRMSSLTGAPAATIHRAFAAKGWDKGGEREATYAGVVGDAENSETSDGSGEQWGYGPDNPHHARVVICDEFSMVDQHLLYRLLACTSQMCRLVFVGDAAQLPSVGAGNVLRDAINTNLFPTVALTEIFRQEETSDIVVAAHAVYGGQIPVCGSSKDSDFVLLEIGSEDDILDYVVKIASKLYGKRENFQVLSPRHAGTLGVTNLNQRLRSIINPKAPGLSEMRLGAETIREDDRVMVVKNDYKLGIFNGDVGKVVHIDRRASEIEVKLHGPPVLHVRIPFKQAPLFLRLAYTMTVHKSQGQEYDIIVMPVVRSFGHQLQRNLFYTAITRAKKRVFLIGHYEAMVKAVHNNKEDVRNTLLPDRLLALAGGLKKAATA